MFSDSSHQGTRMRNKRVLIIKNCWLSQLSQVIYDYTAMDKFNGLKVIS